jgi:hypothetical protein
MHTPSGIWTCDPGEDRSFPSNYFQIMSTLHSHSYYSWAKISSNEFNIFSETHALHFLVVSRLQKVPGSDRLSWHGFIQPLQGVYKVVSKSFRTGRLERELQMVQLSATRCSCIAILVSQSSDFCRHNPLCCFSTSAYYCYFVIDSIRELLDKPL